MSTIVDLRHGRIGTACARCSDPAGEDAGPAPGAADGLAGAEIILFPKFRQSQLTRQRKRLSRRFARRDDGVHGATFIK